MQPQTEPILFFGNERLSTGLDGIETKVLPSLLTMGYSVGAVVIQQSSTSKRPVEVAEYATQHHIPLYRSPSDTELAQLIKQIQPKLGVLVAFGRIITNDILDLFPRGIVNLHPSLLPLYRGSTPIEQVILDGCDTTGVSLMQLAHQMDAGAVYAQEKVSLAGTESKAELAAKLLDLGATMFQKNLAAILAGELKPSDQDEQAATYSHQIEKSDGLIKADLSAEQLLRMVRAYQGWPTTFLQLGHETITLLSAQLSPIKAPQHVGQLVRSNKSLVLPTIKGSVEITHLQLAGKKPISALDYLNSHPQLPTI